MRIDGSTRWLGWLVATALVFGRVPAFAEDGQSQSEEESSAWNTVKELYEKAKQAGDTVPGDVTDWVVQDYQNLGAWEYKVKTFPGSNSEEMEELLNELGQQRWGMLPGFSREEPYEHLLETPGQELHRQHSRRGSAQAHSGILRRVGIAR